MNTQDNKHNTLVIAGLIVLIAALVLGVKLIFWGLEQALPTPQGTEQTVTADASQGDTDAAAPSFCPFCGEKLPESFQWGQFCPFCGEKLQWESA